MRKLYEINADYTELLQTLEEEGGDLSLELEKQWDAIHAERDQKVLNYCAVYKNILAEQEVFAAEAKRLGAIASNLKKQAESLKDFLAQQIEPGEKFEGETHKVSWRKSERVEITDPLSVHESYREPQPDKILKTEIKRAIKEGADIDFAELVTVQNLQIK